MIVPVNTKRCTNVHNAGRIVKCNVVGAHIQVAVCNRPADLLYAACCRVEASQRVVAKEPEQTLMLRLSHAPACMPYHIKHMTAMWTRARMHTPSHIHIIIRVPT